MGTNLRGKACTIADHGDGPTSTTRTLLVLQAWMLHRIQLHGFAAAKRARMLWVEEQTEALRRDVRDLGVPGGGTGNAVADKRLRAWAPLALR